MMKIDPVHLHDTRAKVSNLHKALLFLFLNQSGISDNDRRTLQRNLAGELRTQAFGPATADLVGIWQNQLKNWPNYRPAMRAGIANKVRSLPGSAGGSGN